MWLDTMVKVLTVVWLLVQIIAKVIELKEKRSSKNQAKRRK